MKFPENTRILVAIGDREISTYDANEYFPDYSTNKMASLLRRDERTEMVGKKGAGNRVAMWRIIPIDGKGGK